jgi:hypothetical protein
MTEGIKTIKYDPDKVAPSKAQLPEKQSESTSQVNIINQNSKNWKKIILIPIIGLLVIGGGIGLSIYLINKDKNKGNKIEIPSDSVIIPPPPEEYGPLETQKEYILKTEVGDLKSIYVNQIYYEDNKIFMLNFNIKRMCLHKRRILLTKKISGPK